MTTLQQFRLSASVAVAGLLLFAGCTSENPEIQALQKELLLESEPAKTTSIADARASVGESRDVSIVAQVSNDEFEAFVNGKASFLVNEASHGGGHCENEDCPFCKAEKCNAAVQFVGESGEPLGYDARDLLGIQPGDTVVIQGKAEMIAGIDMLQVTAKSIYIRPRQVASN